MTFRKTTPKRSFRKRRDRRSVKEVNNDEDDGYDTVNPSDESAYPSGSDEPETDAASYQDKSESPSWNDPNDRYVHIAPFPTFHGDECPVAHLSRFAKVCRANNATSSSAMARIFPVTLEAEALLWYDLNVEPYEKSLTWEEIKRSFSDAFGSTTERADLAAIRQGVGESVRSYFLRVQSAMRRLGEAVFDGAVREAFVCGLRGDLRAAVAAENPGLLSEAVRVAMGVKRDSVAVKTCGFCGGFHGERVTEIGRSVSASVAAGGEKKGGKQCQCWKHECWKRNGLQRSRSNFTPFKGQL